MNAYHQRGAAPDVIRDIVVNLRKLVPHHGDYRQAGGNSDAHVKSSMFGCEQMVVVEGGAPTRHMAEDPFLRIRRAANQEPVAEVA